MIISQLELIVRLQMPVCFLPVGRSCGSQHLPKFRLPPDPHEHVQFLKCPSDKLRKLHRGDNFRQNGCDTEGRVAKSLKQPLDYHNKLYLLAQTT